MSNTITLASIYDNASEFSGNLVITNYGLGRIAEKIAKGETFNSFNLSRVAIGDKLNTKYNSSISEMGNPVKFFDIPRDEMNTAGNEFTIRTALNIDGGMVLQEIGLFEVTKGGTYLFAYASGFSMIKSESISYSLVINLALTASFENEHYNNYSVSLNESEYALIPEVNKMFSALTEFQLDFERCVAANARTLGYFKPQLFFERQAKLTSAINSALMFNKYNKTINQVGKGAMTDCFMFTETAEKNYIVRNLCDEESQMEVSGALRNSNKDNIDLTKPNTLAIIANIKDINEEGVIVGKINPDNDEYYFDLRLKEGALQYTIYSYDINRILDADRGKEYYDEKKLVGHYRVICPISDDIVTGIVGKDTMFTFIYNGDKENPKMRIFVGTKEIMQDTSEDGIVNGFVIDNFNYMGPCQEFKTTSTLRNYTQTSSLADYTDPTYYILKNTSFSALFAFNEELSITDLNYLALIYQG